MSTPLTSGPRTEAFPLLTPGGTDLVYGAAWGTAPNLHLQSLTTGKDVALLPADSFQVPQDLSPDGTQVLYAEQKERGPWELRMLSLADRGSSRALFSVGEHGEARLSPDGRWVVFMWNTDGKDEAYLAPVSGARPPVRVSDGEVVAVRWPRERQEVVYLGRDSRVWVVPVRAGGEPKVGRPQVLFRLPPGERWLDFDVTPDGEKFLAAVPTVVGDMFPLEVLVHATPARR